MALLFGLINRMNRKRILIAVTAMFVLVPLAANGATTTSTNKPSDAEIKAAITNAIKHKNDSPENAEIARKISEAVKKKLADDPEGNKAVIEQIQTNMRAQAAAVQSEIAAKLAEAAKQQAAEREKQNLNTSYAQNGKNSPPLDPSKGQFIVIGGQGYQFDPNNCSQERAQICGTKVGFNSTGHNYNSCGIRPDSYAYCIDEATGSLVRVGFNGYPYPVSCLNSDDTTDCIQPIKGIPAGLDITSGTWDPVTGHLVVNHGKMTYDIDIDANSAVASPYALSQLQQGSDIVIFDGKACSMLGDELVCVNRTTGEVTKTKVANAPIDPHNGSAWLVGCGTMYVANNKDSTLIRIDGVNTSSPTATIVGYSAVTTNNDGAYWPCGGGTVTTTPPSTVVIYSTTTIRNGPTTTVPDGPTTTILDGTTTTTMANSTTTTVVGSTTVPTTVPPEVESQAAARELAYTGTSTSGLLAFAMVLLFLGALAIGASRVAVLGEQGVIDLHGMAQPIFDFINGRVSQDDSLKYTNRK